MSHNAIRNKHNCTFYSVKELLAMYDQLLCSATENVASAYIHRVTMKVYAKPNWAEQQDTLKAGFIFHQVNTGL